MQTTQGEIELLEVEGNEEKDLKAYCILDIDRETLP